MHFLEKLFMDVLNLSGTGVLVILAVLLLRGVFYRLPKKFSYVLWAIPAVRLLIPIPFHGVIRISERAADIRTDATLPSASAAVGVSEHLGGQAAAFAKSGSVEHIEAVKPSLLLILACLWLAGMVVFAAKYLCDYCRLREKLRICVEWKRHIYLADGITQPFVMAGVPCKIYLPSETCEKDRRYILLHEQVHVRRGDAFFELLAAVIRCVHWFNPVVWLGVYYFNRDMEMSCDEAVSAGLDEAEKRAYAMELLHYSTGQRGRLQLPCAFGERGVRGRIMNLSKSKQRSKAAFALAGAVVALAAFLLIPNFWDMERGIRRADAADGSGVEHDAPKTDDFDGSGAQATSEQEPEEQPVTDFVSQKQDAENVGEIQEKTIRLNGVPVSMRWQAGECSGDEMEALASLVYDAFAEIYFAGERRPEQMYGLEGLAYDFETANDLLQIFSDMENPMVWRLSVILPDCWREDKGMGMMQDEESQKQEYDIALTKNAVGEWEVGKSAWRVYYDDSGSFRWPES